MKTLIVIDMQNDFINGSLGTKEAIEIVDKVKNKIERYKKANNQIIFTRDTHEDNYLQTMEGKNLPIKHCIKGSIGHEISSELNTESSCILDKSNFGLNWYEKISMENNLIKGNEIELIGICTDICVISNAIILKNLFPEKNIIVDSSCCAGTTPENHNKALDIMKLCQIKVI